jgi:WD40 repeat protein
MIRSEWDTVGVYVPNTTVAMFVSPVSPQSEMKSFQNIFQQQPSGSGNNYSRGSASIHVSSAGGNIDPLNDTSLQELNNAATMIQQLDSPRTEYSKLRNAREQATFNLMMRMDPDALSEIRQEFFRREDSVSLIDFIYIMSKHLIDFANDDRKMSRSSKEERDFVMDMHELFKEVDVNGDGMMEWEEFTKFTVEKASLLNKRFVISTLPEYIDSTPKLDNSMRQFRRHNLFSMLPMPSVGSFAVLEEHRKQIPIYHASDGYEVTTIQLESVPLAIDWNAHSSVLITSTSDLQISTYQQLTNRKFNFVSSWSTPTAQKALAWMESSETLYSGSINGSLHCWKLGDKISESSVTQGHSDILMKLLALDHLDNLMSASLDATIGCWDTYTNTVIHKLRGHSKGIFELSFNPDYRLLFSCGFDHDVFVWSPFVNSLVFKLKGHRASLIGCQSVENSPEIISADEDGVFKLWDVRTFQCVQTFQKPHIINSFEDPNDHLTCFVHTQIPTHNHIPSRHHLPRSTRPLNATTTTNAVSPLNEYRIYAGSRRIISFDQKKIVQEKTTDYTNVMWVAINNDSHLILTASNRNLIIWDLLLGSKMLV